MSDFRSRKVVSVLIVIFMIALEEELDILENQYIYLFTYFTVFNCLKIYYLVYGKHTNDFLNI